MFSHTILTELSNDYSFSKAILQNKQLSINQNPIEMNYNCKNDTDFNGGIESQIIHNENNYFYNQNNLNNFGNDVIWVDDDMNEKCETFDCKFSDETSSQSHFGRKEIIQNNVDVEGLNVCVYVDNKDFIETSKTDCITDSCYGCRKNQSNVILKRAIQQKLPVSDHVSTSDLICDSIFDFASCIPKDSTSSQHSFISDIGGPSLSLKRERDRDIYFNRKFIKNKSKNISYYEDNLKNLNSKENLVTVEEDGQDFTFTLHNSKISIDKFNKVFNSNQTFCNESVQDLSKLVKNSSISLNNKVNPPKMPKTMFVIIEKISNLKFFKFVTINIAEMRNINYYLETIVFIQPLFSIPKESDNGFAKQSFFLSFLCLSNGYLIVNNFSATYSSYGGGLINGITKYESSAFQLLRIIPKLINYSKNIKQFDNNILINIVKSQPFSMDQSQTFSLSVTYHLPREDSVKSIESIDDLSQNKLSNDSIEISQVIPNEKDNIHQVNSKSSSSEDSCYNEIMFKKLLNLWYKQILRAEVYIEAFDLIIGSNTQNCNCSQNKKILTSLNSIYSYTIDNEINYLQDFTETKHYLDKEVEISANDQNILLNSNLMYLTSINCLSDNSVNDLDIIPAYYTMKICPFPSIYYNVKY